MVKMKAPEGSSGCSFDGEEYKVAKDGTVEVPAEAVAQLMNHGFVVVSKDGGK